MNKWEKEWLARNQKDIRPTISKNMEAIDMIKAKWPVIPIHYYSMKRMVADMSGDWTYSMVREVVKQHGKLAFGFYIEWRVFQVYISYNYLANGRDSYWFDVWERLPESPEKLTLIINEESCDLPYISNKLDELDARERGS